MAAKQPEDKSTYDIRSDLAYIDNNIALFALERKSITNLLEMAMKGAVYDMNQGRNV